MSLINRPFRGFSGTYTMPLPALPSPRSTSTSLDSERSTSDGSITCADAAPKPRRGLFHRSKTSPSKHLRPRGPSPSSSSSASPTGLDRPAPPTRAHTAEVPAAPAPPKSRFASLLKRQREERAPSSEEVERELEELYVKVYSKAERRAFFREWKTRQEERDAWEMKEWERGVVYVGEAEEEEEEEGRR
ncbi:hypothetical protein P171DRAFT_30157 [Karstenula rhodostoma CBS 690.94]|uniref:Uncharacterized protein n=1 Tax=Karstenula rhodostoma CBS 690.94 TaxID=1392251 RepID=A0A9P4UBM4_9PLEO|nr:hypothetical protein P171DRAFT_30157 [Karstenula rhodostoma CBS 690.94]